MWRAIASNALTLFIIALAALAGLLGWARDRYTSPGPLTSAVCFNLERGASLSGVSRALKAQNIISDARLFRLGAHYSDQGEALKFGSYLINPKMSMAEVLTLITEGGAPSCGREINFRIGVTSTDVILRELDPETSRYVEVLRFTPQDEAAPQEYLETQQDDSLRYRVTVAEGVTSWQVADSLAHADFLSGALGPLPAEGSLAPGSYEVTQNSDRTELIDKMHAKQTRDLAEAWANRAVDLPYKTAQEALIMASIIEKETALSTERPQVSSVFVNRLQRGIPLQTDPTVIYGLNEGKGTLGRGLRRSELRRETPYNTYLIRGLPPTPIANPGIESIHAALNPADTDYIFFVADGTGGHAFAKTLVEHNRNVARWREIERQQNKEN